MGNRGIDQWEQAFLSHSHFVQHFFWDINELYNLMLADNSLNNLFVYLNILKLLLICGINIQNNPVDIVFDRLNGCVE